MPATMAGSDLRSVGGGLQPPRGGVHDRHRIFDRNRLRAGLLLVELGASEARKNDRRLGQQQMRAVQLGRDVDREIELAHGRKAHLRVRHRHRQVAAHADDSLGFSFADGFDRLDGAVAVLARRLEAESLLQVIEQFGVGDLGDADGAIALHVGMAAQRADAGAFAADLAAHQHEIGELLHDLRAVPVLRQAHAVAEDDVLGGGVDLSRAFDLAPRQTRAALDLLPLRCLDVAHQSLVAGGVIGNEGAVDDLAAVLAVQRQQRLHQSLHHRRVAADAHLVVDGRDLRRPPASAFPPGAAATGSARGRAPSAG